MAGAARGRPRRLVLRLRHERPRPRLSGPRSDRPHAGSERRTPIRPDTCADPPITGSATATGLDNGGDVGGPDAGPVPQCPVPCTRPTLRRWGRKQRLPPEAEWRRPWDGGPSRPGQPPPPRYRRPAPRDAAPCGAVQSCDAWSGRLRLRVAYPGFLPSHTRTRRRSSATDTSAPRWRLCHPPQTYPSTSALGPPERKQSSPGFAAPWTRIVCDPGTNRAPWTRVPSPIQSRSSPPSAGRSLP